MPAFMLAFLVICEKEAEYIDLKFNTSKSVVIRIGKSCENNCENIQLVGAKLDYVSKAKYYKCLYCVGQTL